LDSLLFHWLKKEKDPSRSFIVFY